MTPTLRIYAALSWFFAVGIAAAPGEAFAAVQQRQYQPTCNDCHKMPPIDAPYRNITTGGFLGSHSTHNPAAAPAASCDKCHGGSAAYTTDHMNDFVNMTTNINNSPHPFRATYNKPRFFNWTSNPVMESCSNANCHFETTTPAWSSAPFASPADCGGCHGAAPADGSHPATSGSGKKHGDYYTTTTASCGKCHTDHTATPAPFAHATSVGKRSLAIDFTAAPNNGFGRYTGNVAYPLFLPSQNPQRNGTCKNLYCHSPGTKASNVDPPNVTPGWGGASLTCAGCHKANLASGNAMTSGSHRSHVNGTGIGYTQIKCVTCHAVTASAGMTITNTANHVNGQVTVAFDNTSAATAGTYNGQPATSATPSAKVPGSAFGQCTNVYCHSSGQGDGGTWPPTYQTPTWGNATTGQCGTCHGTVTKHDSSGFNYGTATPLTTGSHSKHLNFFLGTGNVSAERKCAACHSYTLTGYVSNACSSNSCHSGMVTKHANYEINVGIPDYYGATATYNAASLTPGTGYSSCSNVYCHSDGKATSTTYATPTWGNPASGACGTCHGVSATSPPASAPHGKHVASAYPYRYACGQCHNGKVQATANSTVIPAYTNLTTHVDKSRDVKFDPSNLFGTFSSASSSCRNLYCHSTGNLNVTAGNLPGAYGGRLYTRMTWSGATTCSSCHGKSTANGMPDYVSAGGPGAATANSHPKHVTMNSISCGECHSRTTKNGTSIRTAAHVNGSADVFFNLSGANKNGSYNNGTKTCTATFCHSNGRGASAAVRWGDTSNCGICHVIASLGGSHAKHLDLSIMPLQYANMTANRSTTAVYNFGCANCHPLTNGSHTNGTILLDLRPAVAGVGALRGRNSAAITASGAAGTANGGTTGDSIPGSVVKCLNIYCHSNGYTTSIVYATTPNWYGGAFTGDRCAGCHGNAPNSTIAGSKSHYNNRFLGYTSTPGGHQIGIHAMGIYSSPSGLAVAGTGPRSSHGNPATATTIGCNICHYATVTTARNDDNYVCRTCHYAGNGVDALAGNPATIADRSKHVNGTVDVAFKPVTIMSRAQVRQKYFVTHAYSSVWRRDAGYKVSGSYDSAKMPLDAATMWDSSTKTCSSIACHNGNSVKWTDNNGITDCISCHGSL